MEFEKNLRVVDTCIPGLCVVELPVHGDVRGWFKENWQRAKMVALGLPENFRPVQNNISFNANRGVTRGIHAEPWNKFISVATGSVFGAWVDLRPGKSFGRVFTCVLDPSRAIYVPRGVGNSFQALEDGTVYTYLVDAHWSADIRKTYTFVNLADPKLCIEWPIPLSECILSEADRCHPMLSDALPMTVKRTLVIGCNGRLGRAVLALADDRGLLESFDFCDIDTFNLSNPDDYAKFNWTHYRAVINCGAYTAVDEAETSEGRRACWAANATGPALLSRVCSEYGLTLVHISSDYVFDGTCAEHGEKECFSPLSVYGQSKAAGDLSVAGCQSHYIVRSSWVIGDGNNFVLTMRKLARRCIDTDDPLACVNVVDDQFGRLTFATQMAEGIFWLLGYREGDVEPSSPAQYGTYNLTGSGPVVSWAQIAREVFELSCGNGDAVVPVTTAEYYAGVDGLVAPRPAHSDLDLAKLTAAGFSLRNWKDELREYLSDLDD